MQGGLSRGLVGVHRRVWLEMGSDDTSMYPGSRPSSPEVKPLLKEICPRGNNNIVIIIFLIHDNVYIPC
jgi:hypothetical protein